MMMQSNMSDEQLAYMINAMEQMEQEYIQRQIFADEQFARMLEYNQDNQYNQYNDQFLSSVQNNRLNSQNNGKIKKKKRIRKKLLKVFKLATNTEECPICCSHNVEIQIECSYKMCKSCYTTWIKTKKNPCPHCRQAVSRRILNKK